MRINSKPGRLFALSSLGLAFSLALAGMAAAQETQQQKPGNFGPRVKQQQGQAQQGQAPQGQQQAPKVDVIAENGKWKVQCESPPAAEGQKPARQCGMVQVAQSEKNPKASLTLILVKAAGADNKVAYSMRVIAPIGVFLPTGVALEIDGAAVGRVPFTRCMPQVCMAFAEASADTLAKMKKGKEANFIIYEAPGIGLPMKLSLEGFSASLAALTEN